MDSKKRYQENILRTVPLEKMRHVLILRTAQWPIMECLLKIVSEHPSLKTTLLLQETEAENCPSFSSLHTLEISSGILSFRRIKRSTRRACRMSNFDAVLIPLSRNSQEGYENVFSLIPLLTTAPAYAIKRNGEAQEVTRCYPFGMMGAQAAQILKMIFYPFGMILIYAILATLFLVFRLLRFVRGIKR